MAQNKYDDLGFVAAKYDDLGFKPLTGGSAPQVAGDIPAPAEAGVLARKAKNAFIPGKKEIPEFIGGMISQNPIISGVGAAGGEAYKQIGQRAGLLAGTPPESSSQALKQIGLAGARGVGGGLMGKAMGKVFAPFASSAVPEAVVKNTAEVIGQTPPLATSTTNRFVRGVDRMLEFGPFGNVITKQREAAVRGLGEYAERAAKQIAPDKPAEISHGLAKESLNGFLDRFDDVTGKLYGEVMPKLKGQNIQVGNTMQSMQDVIKRRGGTAEPTGLAEVRGWLKALAGKETGDTDVLMGGGYRTKSPINYFEDLKKLRTNIGAKIKSWNDPATSGLQADLKTIYAAITEDLNNSAKAVSPEIYEQLVKANDTFAIGNQTIKDKYFKAMMVAKPGNLGKIIFGSNSPGAMACGKEVLGEETYNMAKREWFDGVLEKSAVRGGGGTISPAKLAGNMQTFMKNADTIFQGQPEQRQMFQKLFDAAVNLSSNKEIGSGSVTAPMMANLWATIANITSALTAATSGNLKALGYAAAGIGAQAGATGLGASKLGKRYLTQGFPKAGKVAGRATQAITQLGLEGLKNDGN